MKPFRQYFNPTCYRFFSILQSEFENFDKIWLESFLEVKVLIILLEDDLLGSVPIGQVLFQSNSPSKKIYLSQSTGQYSFPALQTLKWRLIYCKDSSWVTTSLNKQNTYCDHKINLMKKCGRQGMHVWVFYSIYFTGISFLHSDTVFFT